MTNGSADIVACSFFSRLPRGLAGHSDGTIGVLLPRQVHPEGAALALGRLDPDRAAVPLDDPADQREAEALAPRRVRVEPLEGLEHLGPGVRGDAEAVVPDVVGVAPGRGAVRARRRRAAHLDPA